MRLLPIHRVMLNAHAHNLIGRLREGRQALLAQLQHMLTWSMEVCGKRQLICAKAVSDNQATSKLQMMAQPNSQAVSLEVEWRSESALSGTPCPGEIGTIRVRMRVHGLVQKVGSTVTPVPCELARREDAIIKEREGRLMADQSSE